MIRVHDGGENQKKEKKGYLIGHFKYVALFQQCVRLALWPRRHERSQEKVNLYAHLLHHIDDDSTPPFDGRGKDMNVTTKILSQRKSLRRTITYNS